MTTRQPQGRSTTQADCQWHGSGQWTRRGRDQRSNRAASLVKRISTRDRSLDGSAYCNRATDFASVRMQNCMATSFRPAAVSAIKINGVRSYRRVGSGQSLELSERATIRRFDLPDRQELKAERSLVSA